MEILNRKLALIKEKIKSNKTIKIAIVGLGSVGNYLLNYLNKWEYENIEIYIGTRNIKKAQKEDRKSVV